MMLGTNVEQAEMTCWRDWVDICFVFSKKPFLVFLIFQRIHMFWILIRSKPVRCF